VKAAVAEGVTSPKKIVEYVREKTGLEISPSYASGLKTQLLRSRRKPRQKAPATPVAHPAPQPTPHAPQARGLTPEDLADLAEIAARAGGVGKLREFLDALGKIR